MIREKYLWCPICNELHQVTLFDQVSLSGAKQGNSREQPKEAWSSFVERHVHHKLETLQSIGRRTILGGPPMDPMRVEYIEVTNGQDWFVVRSSTKSEEQPACLNLVPGRLKANGVNLEIQEDEIRREIKDQFSGASSKMLTDEKIELFLGLFKELVDSLNPDEIEICESTDRSVPSGLLDAHLLEVLFDKCTPYFAPAALKDLRRFCNTANGSEGAMSLLIRRQYRIEPSS